MQKHLRCFKAFLIILLLSAGKSAWADTFTQGKLTFTYTLGEDGYSVTDCNQSASGNIDIPATITVDGNTYNVTSIGDWAFSGCSSLNSITIPNSVTSIGNSAFEGCSSLSSITIPEGVTSIGDWAFWGCSSLTVIVIPDGVISIGNSAFWRNHPIDGFYIPQSVTQIEDNAFRETNIIYCANPVPCTAIGDAFWNCDTLYVPQGSGDAYKAAEGWSKCKNIVECENVPIIFAVDGYCYKSGTTLSSSAEVSIRPLKKNDIGAIVIPSSVTYNSKTYNVTSIRECAFDECSSLTSITLPESLTSIGECAFRDCSSLTSITIPEGVKAIGDGVFVGCRSLSSIYIPKNVTSIGDNAFRFCTSLQTILVDNYNPSYSSYKGVLCNKDKTVLLAVPGKLTTFDIWEGVTSIGCCAFSSEALTSVTIPNSVTSIGNSAFGGCSSLSSITIPEGVTSIGDWAFWGCSSLSSITIPEGVTSIGDYAFWDGPAEIIFESVTPPSGKGALYNYDGTRILVPYGCGDIYKATYGSWHSDKIVEMAYKMTNEKGFFRFISVAHNKVIGINADGKPAGVDASAKDINQIWQVIPCEGANFKLYNVNREAADATTAYMPSMKYQTAAQLTDEANAGVFQIAMVDVVIGSFRISEGGYSGINMEPEGYKNGDFILNNWFESNAEFTAQKIEILEVDLKDASVGNAYASLYLPFDVTNNDAEAKAYVGGEIGNGYIKMTEAQSIKAKNGFVMEAPSAKTVTLQIGENSNAMESSLSGTTVSIPLNDDNRNDYLLFGVGDKSKAVGFYMPSGSIAAIPANRAYTDNSSAQFANGLRFLFGDDATGIKGMEAERDETPIYDLKGRRVDNPTHRGIYIKNGKKIIVR